MSENQEYNKEKTETPGELENEIKKAVVGAEIIHETTKYTKESNGGKAETIPKQEAGQAKQTESQAKRYQKGETSTSFTSAATGAEGCQGVARFSGLPGCVGRAGGGTACASRAPSSASATTPGFWAMLTNNSIRTKRLKRASMK